MKKNILVIFLMAFSISAFSQQQQSSAAQPDDEMNVLKNAVFATSEVPGIADNYASQKKFRVAFSLYNSVIRYPNNYNDEQVEKAQNAIASYYEQGIGGVAVNADSANKYYAAAAFMNQNHYWKLAMKCHQDNDDEGAFRACKIAADLDNSKHYLSNILLGVTNYNVGIHYLNGEGANKDLPAAITYFKRSADADMAEAMMLMGKCYEDGTGVEKNITEAVTWYKKAAANYDTDVAKQAKEALTRLNQ